MPTWFPRALRLTIGYVLGTLALLWFLSQVRDLLGLALLAALFSLSLEPAVNRLHRRGWSRGAATATLLVGVLGFFLILGLTVIPIMVKNLGQIADDVPGWIDDVNEFTQREFDVQLIPDTAIDPSQSSVDVAKNFVSDYGGALVGTVGGFVGAIFSVFTIALFVFYMTSNAPKIRRSVVSLLRPERQRDVLWAWNVAIEKTGGYLYQRILLAVINSSLMLVVMLLAGIPFAVPLAVFTGFTAAFIPIVGTYLAGIVPGRRRPGRGRSRSGDDPAGVDRDLPAARELPARTQAEQADDEPEPRHRAWRGIGGRLGGRPHRRLLRAAHGGGDPVVHHDVRHPVRGRGHGADEGRRGGPAGGRHAATGRGGTGPITESASNASQDPDT